MVPSSLQSSLSKSYKALLATVALSLLALSTGCSVNPATGQSQLMLISEAQEIQMGREADPQIINQFGLYPDEEIQDYVSALGQDLAAKSERPHLEWHFRVLDDPLVNAFALPGGYIYITRGIMSHLDSEAELASILGHEIGHVVARHSANQLSKQQLASAGLLVGSVLLDPEDRYLAGLAGVGMQLAFLKFGRDDERQADELGLRYIIEDGYDPRPMTDVFETLGRVSDAAGGRGMPNWLATHPAPENRVSLLSGQIADTGVDFTGRPIRAELYMNHLNGMPYGMDPRQGFFQGNTFYHPELAFQVEFPEGWQTQNARSAVSALSPNKDALMVLTLAEEDTLSGAEQSFFQGQGIEAGSRWTPGIRGFNSLGREFAASSQQQTVRGRVAFVEGENRIYRLLTYTPDNRWRNYEDRVSSAIGTFQEITDRRYLSVQPAKLRVVKLDRDMSLEEFQRRYPSSVDLQTLAIVNQVDEGDTLRAGSLVKRIVGGELPSSR
jgi:predicted Zn-dependent protease